MLKKASVSIFLWILLLPCFADEYSISLTGHKLSHSIPGYYVSDVTLSQREDSCLGFCHPYGLSRYNTIYFKRSIREELKEFIQHSMPKKDSLKPLILKINRLYFYESAKGTWGYTNLDVSLSFILVGDQGLLEDFTASVTITKVKARHPVSFPEIIVDGFDQCFAQYLERKQNGLTRPYDINFNILSNNPINFPGTFPCFKVKKPSRGIYRTWADFRDDTPDTTLFFKVLHDYNESDFRLSKTYLKFSKESEPEKIWGFSDGDSAYFKTGRAFTLIKISGDTLITYGRSMEYANDVTTGAVVGSILGGFLGGALIGGITAATSNPNVVEKLKVDFFNGKLIAYDCPDYTQINSNVVFFLSKVSDPEAILTVYVNGQPLCEMKPGSYFHLKISCHHPVVNIKLAASNGAETSEDIGVELYKTDVYLLKVKNEQKVTINQMHDQMRLDMLKNRTRATTVCVRDI